MPAIGVRKFLLASTSSLYGKDNRPPCGEDADTNRPLSPYAASKKAAETLAFSYHHLHGIDISIPRYFTVYGPAGRPDMSIFRFIRRIAEGEPIVVFGDGTQTRDFTLRRRHRPRDDRRAPAVGLRGDQFRRRPAGAALAVIDADCGVVGKKPRIEYRPAHPADVFATWADISKAASLLGWQPMVSIEEGLRRSVEWYRGNRELARSLELCDRLE